MTTSFATKVTKNIFCYHLVGLNMNVIYSCVNRNVILSDSETGLPISIVEKDEDLDFETFVLIGKNVWLDLIDGLN